MFFVLSARAHGVRPCVDGASDGRNRYTATLHPQWHGTHVERSVMFKGHGTPSASPLGGFKRMFKKDAIGSGSRNQPAAPPPRTNTSAASSPSEDELQSLFSEARRLLAELASAGESPASQQAAVSELKAAIRRAQAALDRITGADEQFVWQQYVCVGPQHRTTGS